ncbi:MAG: hypothetical protein WEB59_04955 [Thermoanaerobaculia bacterium]
MITLLLVGSREEPVERFAAGHPSVEVMTAGGGEEALEKLARNRRIDAVLIVAGAETAEIAAMIREEDPGAPPLYAPASAGAAPAVRLLGADSPERLLEAIVQALSADG